MLLYTIGGRRKFSSMSSKLLQIETAIKEVQQPSILEVIASKSLFTNKNAQQALTVPINTTTTIVAMKMKTCIVTPNEAAASSPSDFLLLRV
jgi:Holliday junction resolvasome RuvABC endonuclease subunit